MFVVVGRHSTIIHGPFGTKAEARRFITVALGSSSRYYSIETLLSPSLWLKGN